MLLQISIFTTKMPFNFNRKTVFLTYPQTSFDKQGFRDYWNAKHALTEYVIAQEAHADGNPHMHCFLSFRDQVHTRDERYFDYEGRHPNIKTPNKLAAIEAVKKYCMKEGDYIKSEGLVILGKREALFATLIDQGMTKKVILENPTVMALNFSSIKGWLSLIGKENQLKPERMMPKKRHFWIFGPSNSGKTTWRRMYSELFISAQIPENNDWVGTDQDTEVLYADEYKGFLTVQFLNKLCDGRIKCNTKGASTFLDYPRVIICSNFSIRDCYSKIGDVEYESLRNRFIEFEIRIERGRGLGFPKLSEYAVCEL